MNENQSLPLNSILHGKTYQYCIEKVLGQGTFGITYLARINLVGTLGNLQTSVKVAVKEFFMRDINGRRGTSVMTGVDSELFHNYRKDFIREANNLSRLQHPHIVKVLESFEENNTAYYSMEYVDGVNLNDFIRLEGPLSEREALENMLQIVDALTCMHSNRMLHLDLKPNNIMRGSDGKLVLIDFGLSRQFNSDGELESSSRIGLGTIGYAPMEQFNYKKRDGFSPTLDIYATGGILFKMLTGTTPPDSFFIFNDGFPEKEMVDAGVSQAIIALTKQTMDPMARKRPQTAEELMHNINQLLHNVSGVRQKRVDVIPKSGEDTYILTTEVCCGFHINWAKDVSEHTMSAIRKVLGKMEKIGDSKHSIYTEYGSEEISFGPIMSMGENTWSYLDSIFVSEDTAGYFPSLKPSVDSVLRLILELSCITGLPFRLARKDELRYTSTVRLHHRENRNTLCYSIDDGLQIQTYDKQLFNVNGYQLLNVENLDIQIVCDGVKPHYSETGFNVPCTQDFVDEIIPIGFDLYKVRKGNKWNIKSPFSPMYNYLPEAYEHISSIGIIHVPGGGPMNGFFYLGIEARKPNFTSYYLFEKGKFKIIETLSDRDRDERAMWT